VIWLNKINIFQKINKSTSRKALVVAFIIIIVEVLTSWLIYNTYRQYIYQSVYTDFSQSAYELSLMAEQQVDSVDELYTQDTQNELLNKFESNVKFDGFVVFTEASTGRIVGSNWALKDNLSNYGIDYTKVQLFDYEGQTYIFAAQRIGGTAYYVGGIAQFAPWQTVIDGMITNVIALIIAACVIILAAFTFYVYWAGGYKRVGSFAYKVKVDKDNNILYCNKKFKREFGDIKQIDADITAFDRNSYNVLGLKSLTGERVLVTKASKRQNGGAKLYLNDIKNSDVITGVDGQNAALSSNGKAKASLNKTFSDFIKRGKRTLIGTLYLSNLSSISALFGKEMALNLQQIIIKRAKDKFIYVYELDLGQIEIVYPDGKNLDILLSDMDEIIRYIKQPIKAEDNLFSVDVKAGFALCDSTMENLTFDYALTCVEAARRRVTDTGIADYIIYHEAQKKLYAKYFIKYDIKQMLAENAFELEYQPQYNIKEGRIDGFEALFRVKKSRDVNVDTFSFITYAERTGAMVQLGEFIFDTGMAFAKQLEGKNVSVSLNVSPVQLMQAGFVENFMALYKKYQLKPGSICVEITESFLMENFNETLNKLEILNNNGIAIHLDDFGTEYSSLLYIKKLPISTIKIDKEFVKDVTKNNESQAVIKFITNIAELLNLTTICEGVETGEEYNMLKSLGCDTIQGWLIGKSMKPEDALKLVDDFYYDDNGGKVAA
jgi:EAL domain-containing protein (putative c-di-GMP-specific phosphodiesterase class I)